VLQKQAYSPALPLDGERTPELAGGTRGDEDPLWFHCDNEYVAFHGVGGFVAAMYIPNMVAAHCQWHGAFFSRRIAA
jgi:hypothetical protein